MLEDYKVNDMPDKLKQARYGFSYAYKEKIVSGFVMSYRLLALNVSPPAIVPDSNPL